jgi:hypothetical protein
MVFSDLDSIMEQVTSKEPNMKLKTIEDPLLPGMITAVSVTFHFPHTNPITKTKCTFLWTNVLSPLSHPALPPAVRPLSLLLTPINLIL